MQNRWPLNPLDSTVDDLPQLEAAPEPASAFVHLPIAPMVPALGDIRIEVRRGNTAIKVEWPVQASGDCAAWLRDWLR